MMNTYTQKTILLVEDEAIQMMGTVARLKRFGYSVIGADNGKKSVQIAKGDERIDLVLMDISLGKGIDGLEAARQILSKRELPIIFLTSHLEEDIVAVARGITGYGYVIKDSNDFVLESSIEMAFALYNAHRKIRESEGRYRTMVEWSPLAIVVHREGKILYANPAAITLFGVDSIDDHIGLSIFNRVHRDYQQIIMSRLRTAVENGTGTAVMDAKFLRIDGTAFDAEVQSIPIVYEGNPAIHTTLSDISERKCTEETLARERYRLAGTLMGTNAGTWEWNVQTGETVFNERWAEIAGYTLEELSPVSIHTWWLLCHPDDIALSNELLNQHFLRNIEYYEAETRMKHKNGEWIWVTDRGKVASWTDEGKPLVMFGTHMDITQRKIIELQLQRSKTQYDNLVAKLPVGVYIMHSTPSGNFSFDYLSPRIEEIFDIPAKIFLADPQRAFDPVHPDDLDVFFALNQNVFRHPRQFEWAGRIIVRGKSGGYILHRLPNRSRRAMSYGMALWRTSPSACRPKNV